MIDFCHKISLTEILTASPILGKIVNKVEQLAKLNSIIHQKLDPKLGRFCRVTNCRDNILILTTSSPALGHLLRFEKIELLTTLRADPMLCHLKSIDIKVRPLPFVHESITPQCPIPKPVLSKLSSELIQNTALNIDFPALRAALLRLSTPK
jgi:hypothetical protein